MHVHVEDFPATLPPALVAEVESLLQEVEAADGVAALSEQFLRGLADAAVGHRHRIARRGDVKAGVPADGVEGELVGVLAAGAEDAELAVAPGARRAGVATALLEGQDVNLWAHGDLEPARGLAAARGMEAGRTLLVMGIDNPALAAAVEGYAVPEGLVELDLAESCARWGEENVLSAWVQANNEAFDWHPEQGGWDVGRLRRGTDTEWFDPRGVRFYWMVGENDTSTTPVLVGFHWTKMLKDVTPVTSEVYVVGLAHVGRGKGWGGPLVQAGLVHLVGKGAGSVILYVESDNLPAIRAYEELGFGVCERHTLYRK